MGTIEDGNYPETIVYDMTLDGEIRWYESWGCGDICSVRPQQVLKAEENTYLLVEEDDDDFQTFYTRTRSILIKVSDTGEELWRVYPGDHENFWIDPGGIIEQDDGILVFYANPKYYDSDGEWHANLNSSCLLYTSPSPRDRQKSRMPSSA